MKKGFTLIELLAVIVILTIIAIITIPLINNVIEKSKEKALENSAYGIIESANLYYAKNIETGISSPISFECTETGCKSTSGEELKYKGKIMSGTVILNPDGKINLCITDNINAVTNLLEGNIVEKVIVDKGTCNGLVILSDSLQIKQALIETLKQIDPSTTITESNTLVEIKAAITLALSNKDKNTTDTNELDKKTELISVLKTLDSDSTISTSNTLNEIKTAISSSVAGTNATPNTIKKNTVAWSNGSLITGIYEPVYTFGIKNLATKVTTNSATTLTFAVDANKKYLLTIVGAAGSTNNGVNGATYAFGNMTCTNHYFNQYGATGYTYIQLAQFTCDTTSASVSAALNYAPAAPTTWTYAASMVEVSVN